MAFEINDAPMDVATGGPYLLMSRRPDKQDLGVVEKIYPCKEDIFQLCNDFCPGLVKITEDRWKLQQSPTTNPQFGVIGFYGNKEVMKLLCSKHKLLGGEEVLAKMDSGEMEPGLHACWHSGTLCLLYWHGEGEMEEARKSSLSCSFVRYLFELCDVVYACINVQEASMPLAVPKNTRKKRTQRLRISVVQAAKDDVEITGEYTMLLKDVSSLNKSNAEFVKFSQTAQRPALLVSRAVPAIAPFSLQKKTLDNKGMLDLLSSYYSSGHDFDVLDLKENELELFVKLCSKKEMLDKMKRTLKDFQQQVKVDSKKLEALVAKSLTMIQEQIAEWMKISLIESFPWAEGQIASTLSSTSDKTRWFTPFTSWFNGKDRQREPTDPVSISLLNKAKFSNVLFVGSEFEFEGAPDISHLGNRFRVMSCGGKGSGPVLYDENVEMESSSFQVFLFVFSRPGKPRRVVWLSDQFKADGSDSSVIIRLEHVEEHVKMADTRIKFSDSTESVAMKWIQEHVRRTILPFEQRACLANVCVANGFAEASDVDWILKHGCNHLDGERRELAEQQWKVIVESDVKSRLKSLLPEVKDLVYKHCKTDVMEDCKTDVMGHFSDVIENIIKPSIEDMLQAQVGLIVTNANEDMNRRRTAYLANLQEELFPSRGFPKMKITGFVQNKRATNDLTMEFNMEQQVPEQLRWSLIECMGMKKDLDMQASNPQHVVNICTLKEESVAQLDPAVFRFGNVAILRSGRILFWSQEVEAQEVEQPCFHVYLGGRKVKKIKQVVDLVAFDETSNFMAFYCKQKAIIQIFKLDETKPTLQNTGTELELNKHVGVGAITYIQFVPKGSEIVCIDESRRVLIFDLNSKQPKPKVVHIPQPFHQARVCPTCLLVISRKENEKYELWVEAFSLDGEFSSITSFQLNVPVQGEIDTSVVMFGSQVQLLISQIGKPEIVYSKVLKITSASEACEIQGEDRKTGDGVDRELCAEMSYFHYAFEKYAITAPLMKSCVTRNVRFCMLLHGIEEEITKAAYLKAAEDAMAKLRREKGRNSLLLEVVCEANFFHSLSLSQFHGNNSMADWILHLICLVPVQIARAENNSLKPLVEGFEIPTNVNITDAKSLSSALEFGFYDFILDSWRKEVKVLSSMGKQSSGKSYLLNHLSGSLLDVSGGRCTDGVWMTIRQTQDCMYVILDFEGLGSFERSDQEDMLLSLLNAAISNITIYNKKDFHLDKDTEALFDRFQNGVSCVTEDAKLFRGLFYIAVKDVALRDIDELIEEFDKKIRLICNKTQNNFLLRMYAGQVETAAMPPFEHPEFYDSIHDIADTIEELSASYKSGRSFLGDFKLIIAQICSKDWASIDSKRIALKLDLLEKHLHAAVTVGALAGSAQEQLIDFDTDECIPDRGVLIDFDTDESLPDSRVLIDADDSGLELSPVLEGQDMDKILESLVSKFKEVAPRMQQVDDNAWHQSLEDFLVSLVERRKQRVLEWIKVNTKEICDNGEVDKLIQKAQMKLSELKENMTLCSVKCEHCFLKCVLRKRHSAEHSCQGSHKCVESCTYCKDEISAEILNCGDVAGHAGSHDCKDKSHTCGEKCNLATCKKRCAKKISHDGEHICNSLQHLCIEKCCVLACSNNCIWPVEKGEHDTHKCHERLCPSQCSVDGCRRQCEKEHLHSLLSGNDEHFCNSEHPCKEKCEAVGNCEVLTEFTSQKSIFHGKRSDFEYDYVSEQNGVRKDCCLAIPPYKYKHDGQHVHSKNKSTVHFCNERCQGCGYFCNIPIGHNGPHHTTHGNMKSRTFVAEKEDFDLGEGRKYKWGESGIAEMCTLHCKAQGRGHIHVVKCERPPTADVKSGRACAAIRLPDGGRHQTKIYGPNFDVEKDELTHEAYWRNMGFKDPSTEQDQKQFKLCNHSCPSTVHTSDDHRSYCTEELWHKPVESSAGGSVSKDGHKFDCKHAGNHIIFVIDRSGSMSYDDIKPTITDFSSTHNNRLGCVYEAIRRFVLIRIGHRMNDTLSAVLFDGSATIVFEDEKLEERTVMKLKDFKPQGWTNFDAGLEKAQEIVQRSLSSDIFPAVIFLSDGEDGESVNLHQRVQAMKRVDNRVVIHTVKFGASSSSDTRLKQMATAGNGTFTLTLDQCNLANTFGGFALSIKPNVSALM